MNVWWMLLAVGGLVWFWRSTLDGRRLSLSMPATMSAAWAVYAWTVGNDGFSRMVCTVAAVWLGVAAWREHRKVVW